MAFVAKVAWAIVLLSFICFMADQTEFEKIFDNPKRMDASRKKIQSLISYVLKYCFGYMQSLAILAIIIRIKLYTLEVLFDLL